MEWKHGIMDFISRSDSEDRKNIVRAKSGWAYELHSGFFLLNKESENVKHIVPFFFQAILPIYELFEFR